ncbi:MAG: adenylate/guanylate cyclase domain-containing protein [Muriicola sp.]
MPQSRQLAAIMFTDIVGYTALMGKDEQAAFRLLQQNRKLQKPIIEEFNGRWIKELGDGVMASFNTVSDAVNAAIKIQEACNSAMDFQLRIGIHQGEVLFENDDVFGDAVNIAARIQGAAQPGCIFISETVQHNVTNKNEFKSQFVKEMLLKNVPQPMRMYQVLFAGSEIIEVEKLSEPEIEKSIAVLPFVNMSSDPEQEYFSDGISEEIINMLAQVPDLKVIARTSSFSFKGKNQDVRFIGGELKVSHILEGSVRKSGNKLRITAQLINVADGTHIYSEKFDRELKDIFEIQDEISEEILDAIKIKLFGSEIKAVFKKYTDNLEAYQLYLKGKFHYNKYTREGFLKAIDYFTQAIALDANYAIAYAGISYCYHTLSFWNWIPAKQAMPLSLQAGKKSIELDDQIAESLINLGRKKLHYDWNARDARVELKKALAINPNLPEVYIQLGFCAVLSGDNEQAMAFAEKAIELDPFSIMNLWMATIIPTLISAYAEKALELSKQLIELNSDFFGGHLFAGMAYLKLGKFEEALYEVQVAVNLENIPYTLSSLGTLYGVMGDTDKARETIEEIKNIENIEELESNSFLGDVYLIIGEWELAFEYFDKGIANREGHMIWKKWLFGLVPNLMEDPRAIDMFEKMNVVY